MANVGVFQIQTKYFLLFFTKKRIKWQKSPLFLEKGKSRRCSCLDLNHFLQVHEGLNLPLHVNPMYPLSIQRMVLHLEEDDDQCSALPNPCELLLIVLLFHQEE